MRLIPGFLALLLCSGPLAAQQVAAPRIRLAPVPVGAAALGATLSVAPSLAPTLPTAPSLTAAPSLLSPSALVLPASALPAKAQAQAVAAPSGPGPGPAAAAAAPSSPHPMRLILMGPPGSGKTTYGKRLAAEYGMVHLSVGQLLRDYAKERPDVAAVMAQGDLVDSALVLGLVRDRLSKPDIREKGYVLDGFPRRLEEAVPLEGWLGEIGLDAVVHLEVPQSELLRRIHARGRADDTDEVFANRMDVYRKQTLPVLERFRSGRGVLMPEVSGSDPEANYARLRSILEEALAP